MAETQDNRNIKIDTPLGKDELLLESLEYSDHISSPFQLIAHLRSAQKQIDPTELPGKSVTVTIMQPDGSERYVNGIVSSFHKLSSDMDMISYRAEIVPWFSLLKLSSDCRIFQKMTVPDILKQVFSEQGFSDYEINLTDSYPERGICTQYLETHFSFASRLMEEEGIAYHFSHQDGKHTLVLTDRTSAFSEASGYEELPFLPQDQSHDLVERVESWNTLANIQTASVSLNDYDYTRPRTDLTSSNKVATSAPATAGETYHSPGGYFTDEDGEHYARIRAEELAGHRVTFTGEACCVGLGAGNRFSIKGSPGGSDDKEFLITASILKLTAAEFRTSGPLPSSVERNCQLEARLADQPFRPAPTTPKPKIAGVQTAVVTGPDGYDAKIPYCTSIGSLKVQFRWDRHGKDDEQSSGWIRVAQVLAGNQYGAVFLPRIGNEVVVSFEEGDPDRPLIVGSVYNSVNTPSLVLPHFAQRCYIHDDGGNALCFTPEKGNQSIIIYSPYQNTMRVVGAGDEAAYNNIPTQPQFP